MTFSLRCMWDRTDDRVSERREHEATFEAWNVLASSQPVRFSRCCFVWCACSAGHRVGNMVPLNGTPTKMSRNNSAHSSARKEDNELKRSGSSAAAAAAASSTSAGPSASTTPATSPMVRGLSSLGLLSPRVSPLSTPPLIFSVHRHIINMRCPDLLKSVLTACPPTAHFDEAQVAAGYTPYQGPSASPTEERKSGDDTGGRSLADQEMASPAAAAAASTASTSSILQSSYSLSDAPFFSSSPDVQPSASPAPSPEEKARSLDDDEDMQLGGGLARATSSSGGGGGSSGFTELHPSVETFDISCVPNAITMQNLLTYIYTGDLAMNLLPNVQHVFELATVARLFHLDRLQDLCALALNRMLQQDNFLVALKFALHFQSKVVGDLDQICQELADALAATTVASELSAPHSTICNAKIHPHLSPLVRVCLEYLVLHWDLCWESYATLRAFQQLPPAIFALIMRLMPLKNASHAPFSVIYPTIHPQACNLAAHFKRMYEDRTEETTDFRIIVGDDEDNAIYVHKAVLG